MSVYRLEARQRKEQSPHWKRSTIGAMTCWVSAESGEGARELVTSATIVATRAKLGDDSPIQPWMNDELASCVLDDALGCAEGEILTADGQKLTIDR